MRREFSTPTTENASLSSQKSIWLMSSPAFSTALGTAKEGEVVNHSGACSASAYPRMIAIGLQPSSRAFSLLIKTSAAAPSFMVDAFAAVTLPSFRKALFNSGILSNFTLKGSSSVLSITGSPFRWGMATGIISSLNFPSLMAHWLLW